MIHYLYYVDQTYSTHLAGKSMESAAQILAQNLHQPDRAADAYRRASELFVTQGKKKKSYEIGRSVRERTC